MKLLTKTLYQKLRKNNDQENCLDKKPVVKLFNPTGAGTWWLWSIDEDNVCFGVAEINTREFGYISLEELTSFKGRYNVGIERDKYYSADETFDELLNGDK